jgi:hypothetical protein
MVPRVRTRRQGSCHASAEHFQQCAELPPLGRLLSCQYPAQQTSGCRRLSARCYRLGGIPAVFPIRPPASFQTFRCARAGARTAMHSTAAISHRSALTRAAPSIPCASTRYLRAPSCRRGRRQSGRRNSIAHSAWKEGARPRSIKPFGLSVRGGTVAAEPSPPRMASEQCSETFRPSLLAGADKLTLTGR